MSNAIYQDYISQGVVLMAAENYEAAYKVFSDAVQEEPREYDAYIHLGNACVNLDKMDEAIAAFKNALLVKADDPVALYSIGCVHLLKGERLKTVEYYNKAEAAGMKNPDLYQYLAVAFFEANDVQQALRNINKAINLNPLSAELRLFKVRMYIAADRPEEALETLDEMAKYIPDAYEIYGIRTDIYLNKGNIQQALEISAQGLERFPEDAFICLNRLKALVGAERFDEALELVEKLKSNEKYDDVRKAAVLHEMSALLGKDRIKDAIKLLDDFSAEKGDDEDVLFMQASLCLKESDFARVHNIAERLIKVAARDSYLLTAKYYIAFTLSKMGEEEKARSEYKKLTVEFRRATIDNPALYEGYIYRILCHTEIGEYEQALSLADYIESINIDSADANSYRYYIYKKMGDNSNAEKAYAAARRKNPNIVL